MSVHTHRRLISIPFDICILPIMKTESVELEGNEIIWDENVIKNQMTEKVKICKKYSFQQWKSELETKAINFNFNLNFKNLVEIWQKVFSKTSNNREALLYCFDLKNNDNK
jgi:hypothetical protein